jgi:ABC-type transporter Mla subunit MlaD
LGEAIAARREKHEPSDEASAELAKQSRDVDRLVVRVSTAGGELADAADELSQALREIGADSALTTEAQQRLDSIRRDVPTLSRNAERAITSLKRAVRSEADALFALSEDLKPEPPDVVLDCTSTVETASDVSVRNLSCEEADALILQAIPALAPSFSVGEYTCTILGDYGPRDGPILGAEDVRCESGDRAFRFGFAD